MSGFIQFTDGAWSYSSWMTRIVFDMLVDRLPEGDPKDEIAELRDNNVLMLDLRDPTQELLVRTVVDDLNDYVAKHFDADTREKMKPGHEELLELATAQYRRNRGVVP